jgi:F-type H+-transporting ATPase subunit delta
VLTDIADEYNRLFNNLNGTVRAQVVTAISLDEEQKLKISQRLGDMTGKKVILEPEIDPDIIGGIIVKIGDKLMDGSIRGKLEAMKKLMAGL